MRIPYFIGLVFSILFFGMPWLLSEDRFCYISGCTCSLDIAYRPFHILGSLAFASFFLIFNLSFLYKFQEIRTVESRVKMTESNVYELPFIRILSKIGIGLSLALFPFASFFMNTICLRNPICEEGPCDPRFALEDEKAFAYVCCAAGLYFTILTAWSLRKVYQTKR